MEQKTNKVNNFFMGSNKKNSNKKKDYSKYKDISFGVGKLHTGRVAELYDNALDKIKNLVDKK
jgi:hypothetical protein